MASAMRPLFALCTPTSLLGCAGFPLQIEQIPVSEDPPQQISRLGEAVERAREGDVDVLAPSWFARAEESLGEALEV